ncbi:MAG: DUF5071 domain-containing protein [Leptospiraceae bacterium]|nr:DUF5071 domain-containing protein [Leptospiraceae bacterium]
MSPEELRKLIPDSKHDVDRIEKLSQIGYPGIRAIVPELFEWIQDINWPVARPLVSLLALSGEDGVRCIRNILSGSDAMWQYWCVTEVVPQMPQEFQKQLIDDFKVYSAKAGSQDEREVVSEMEQVAQGINLSLE